MQCSIVCRVADHAGAAGTRLTSSRPGSTVFSGDIEHLGETYAGMSSSPAAEIVVRPLVERDVEPFVAWRGGDSYKDAIARKEIEEHFAGKRVLFVAELDGELAGTVQFVPRHEDPDLGDGASTAYLQALEVREDMRRRGLGSRLIRTVESTAVSRGFSRLTLMVEPDNAPALSLYEKMGFRVFKRSSELWRGRQLPTLCMAKDLKAAQ